jgi:hypothetical protein
VGRIALLTLLLSIAQGALTLLTLAGALIAYNPWLLLLLAFAVIPSFLGETHFASLGYSLLFRWTPERRQLDYLRFVGASDKTAKEVQMFGLAPWLTERYRSLSQRFYDENRSLSIRRGAVSAALSILGTIGYYAAYVIVLLNAVRGEITIGTGSRLHRLLDSRFSGLPEQLARVPGRQAGAVSLHKAVVALAMDNRLLSTPASVHVTDTSTGQEDVQALTFLVAERLDRSLSNLETALACELTALRHAAALRPEPIAAPALAATLSSLADLVPPLEEDRMLSPEVERVRALLQGGALAGP